MRFPVERSFVATTLFALLALAMAFIGNLVLLGLTGSAEHSAGTLAALLACGAAYIAQDRFTRSSYWLNEYEQTPVAPVDRDPWRRHVAAEEVGAVPTGRFGERLAGQRHPAVAGPAVKAFATGVGIMLSSIALGTACLLVAPYAGPVAPGMVVLGLAIAVTGVEWDAEILSDDTSNVVELPRPEPELEAVIPPRPFGIPVRPGLHRPNGGRLARGAGARPGRGGRHARPRLQPLERPAHAR